MILVIKAKAYEQLPDGSLRITTDCESLKAALAEHSPNIVVDYLYEQYGIRVTPINYKRKEAKHGTV